MSIGISRLNALRHLGGAALNIWLVNSSETSTKRCSAISRDGRRNHQL